MTTPPITQQYDFYTNSDHEVWQTLYKRQLKAVKHFAYEHFLTGIELLSFQENRIPDFAAINERLARLNGWSIYAVPGLIDNKYFFEQMRDKKFGATAWIRKPSELDYLEEPDMFHDVFGHVPLLADPCVTVFLEGLARIANRYMDDEVIIESIARLYWYTVEFGLVRENEELKIYGAGIISSIGESKFALSGQAGLEPFDIKKIIATPYIKDKYQEQYFVLDSMKDLEAALPFLERHFLFN